MNLRGYIKQFLLDRFPLLSRKYFFKEQILIHGSFSNWQDAANHSFGYDNEKVIIYTLNKLSKYFEKGRYGYEKDGLLFEEKLKDEKFLNSLLIASRKNERLAVFDFGGGFGSLYFNNIDYLPRFAKKNWHILELNSLVKKAREIDGLNRIHFTSSQDDFVKKLPGNFLILSSVLQYLKNPYDIFEELIKGNPSYVFIDRTPFLIDERLNDRLMVQENPCSFGGSSYPIWLFSNCVFSKLLKKYGFRCIEQFDSADKLSHLARWKGGLWKNEHR